MNINALRAHLAGTKAFFEKIKSQLLTLEQLRQIKAQNPNQYLISIMGEKTPAWKANEDTRAGFVAYVPCTPENERLASLIPTLEE